MLTFFPAQSVCTMRRGVNGGRRSGQKERGRIIDVFALLEGFANLNEKSVKEREGRGGKGGNCTTWSCAGSLTNKSSKS